MGTREIYSLIRTIPPVIADPTKKMEEGEEYLTDLFAAARFVIAQYEASQRCQALTVEQRVTIRRRLDLTILRLEELIEDQEGSPEKTGDEAETLVTAYSLLGDIGVLVGMDAQQLQAHCESLDLITLLS